MVLGTQSSKGVVAASESSKFRDSPGSSVVGAPYFLMPGVWVYPWLGTEIKLHSFTKKKNCSVNW